MMLDLGTYPDKSRLHSVPTTYLRNDCSEVLFLQSVRQCHVRYRSAYAQHETVSDSHNQGPPGIRPTRFITKESPR